MATLRPLFSLGNKLFLRPANKGSGFLSMVQQHSNTTENDSKKGGTDSKKGEKDSQKITIPVDNDSLTRAAQKLDRKKPEKNAWGVLKEGFAEISALSQKIDQKKPEINSSLSQKFAQFLALAQKFNQPLSQNVDLKKPEINSALSQKFDQKKPEIDCDLSQKVDQKKPEMNSALAQKVDQKKPEIDSDLSKKVDQKKPEINSGLSQKVDQKKPEIYSDLSQRDNPKKSEKNSSYETELYYPNKTVSVPTLNLSSTVSVTEQLKGIDAQGSLSGVVEKANEESDKAKKMLAQAGDQKERDRLNRLLGQKNIETAKTLWEVGLYLQRKGDLLEARDNLLEAFDLAIAIEGRESQEGATQNYLSQDIEDACDIVLDLVRKEKKKGNIPQDA